MTTKKININKLLEAKNFYVPKDLFNYDLSVPEIRLLIILSTRQANTDGLDFTVDSLGGELKHFIDSKKNGYCNISKYAERLTELDLINSNGTGKKLENGYVLFSEFPAFKSIRQLFLLCCKDNKWHKNGNIYINVSMFKNMFGEKTKRINETWRNTNKQLNTDFSYTYTHNSVEIIDNIKPSKEKVKVKKEDKKVNKELVDKLREGIVKPKINSFNSSNIPEPDCEVPSDEELGFGTEVEGKQASVEDLSKMLDDENFGIKM